MTRNFLKLAAAGLLASIAVPALAADLPDVVYEPVEQPVIQEKASGWYLRADLGYTFEARSNGYFYGYDASVSPDDYVEYPYDDIRYKWRHDISAGVGYQFNDHLRADVTIAHWGRDVYGSAGVSFPCATGFPSAATCRFDDRSSLNAWEAMANAYVDLAHFGRFTPYLGAGAGLARLQYGTLTNDAICVDGAGGDVAGCGYTGHHAGLASTRFAWALMAGTSIEVTKRVKFDVGYRFSHIQGGATFGYDELDTAAGATGTQSYDNGFSQHALRAGIRVAFW